MLPVDLDVQAPGEVDHPTRLQGLAVGAGRRVAHQLDREGASARGQGDERVPFGEGRPETGAGLGTKLDGHAERVGAEQVKLR